MHKWSGITTPTKVNRTEKRTPGVTQWIISKRIQGVKNATQERSGSNKKLMARVSLVILNERQEIKERPKWRLVKFKIVLIIFSNKLFVFVFNKNPAVWHGK